MHSPSEKVEVIKEEFLNEILEFSLATERYFKLRLQCPDNTSIAVSHLGIHIDRTTYMLDAELGYNVVFNRREDPDVFDQLINFMKEAISAYHL